MKHIMIIGFSGSGKSTLARLLGEKLNIQPTYMDTISWLPNWVQDSDENMIEKLRPVIEQDEWIIDGNYSRILFKERLEKADTVIFMDFNRFKCFYRVVKRRIRYNNQTRPDMTDGCEEKFDLEFAKWVLWKGRRKRRRNCELMMMLKQNHKDKKVYTFHNQRRVNEFLKNL